MSKVNTWPFLEAGVMARAIAVDSKELSGVKARIERALKFNRTGANRQPKVVYLGRQDYSELKAHDSSIRGHNFGPLTTGVEKVLGLEIIVVNRYRYIGVGV